MPSQKQMQFGTFKKIAECDKAFLEMVENPEHPLTSYELQHLIEKRPSLWGRYTHWVKVLAEKGCQNP